MASEDLGYWTFRGSDVRALLFYLSGDVQGAGDSPRVSGGKGEERTEAAEGERERQTEIRQKRGEGAERNEVSQRETLRRESEGDGNEERRREDWEEQERRDHFSHWGTDPQLIIPSYLHLSVPSLTLCI